MTGVIKAIEKDVEGLLKNNDPELFTRYQETAKNYKAYKETMDKVGEGLRLADNKMQYLTDLDSESASMFINNVITENNPDKLLAIQEGLKKNAIEMATDRFTSRVDKKKLYENADKLLNNGLLPEEDVLELLDFADTADFLQDGVAGISQKLRTENISQKTSEVVPKVRGSSQIATDTETALQKAGGAKRLEEMRTQYDKVVDNITKVDSEQQFDTIWNSLDQATQNAVSRRSILNTMDNSWQITKDGNIDFSPSKLKSSLENIGVGSGSKQKIMNKLYKPEQQKFLEDLYTLVSSIEDMNKPKDSILKSIVHMVLGGAYGSSGNLSASLYHLGTAAKGAKTPISKMSKDELRTFVEGLSGGISGEEAEILTDILPQIQERSLISLTNLLEKTVVADDTN